MIVIKLNLSKLNKEKLKRDERGISCELVLFEKPSQNDDGFVVQGLSKEEREAGEKGPICGNWKELDKKAPPKEPYKPTIKQPPPPDPQKALIPDDDDIPF